MDISPGGSTPTSEIPYCNSSSSTTIEPTPGPVLLATALPRLISHSNITTPPTNVCQADSSPLNSSQNIPSNVLPPSSCVSSNSPGPPGNFSQIHVGPDTNDSKSAPVTRQIQGITNDKIGHVQVLNIDTNHIGPLVEGPPTPTHSEAIESTKGKDCVFAL